MLNPEVPPWAHPVTRGSRESLGRGAVREVRDSPHTGAKVRTRGSRESGEEGGETVEKLQDPGVPPWALWVTRGSRESLGRGTGRELR